MRHALTTIVMLLSLATVSHAGSWEPLFNGRDLAGWSQRNGQATYTVRDGALVGTTVVGSPNSFLCTTASYGDFIFECKFMADWGLNSGVQVRSEQSPAVRGGRVYGYQVEIDPSDRAWTGGIYDESRRGWLHTLEAQPASRQAYHKDGWNLMRVEAHGTSIRTWVNGVPCADILDDTTPRGFIGLQVHGVGNDSSKAGMRVRWRDLRIMTSGLDAEWTANAGTIAQYNYVPNTISSRERADGWRLLWDGQTTKGWRGAKLEAFPSKGWDIVDGALTVTEAGGFESRMGGDIVTVDEYTNFVLTVDFRIATGANSGIKYFVDPGLNKGEGSAIGCEYQILDDAVHEDAKKGVNGNRKLAGLYDLIPPQNVRFNGIDEWNRATVIVNVRHCEHWLNGFKTVEYERATQMWRALVDHSKYVVWPSFGEAPRGHILLQDHGNRVSFRSIKIHPLP
jgi:hypothetical protein